jgi:hypothetical protein
MNGIVFILCGGIVGDPPIFFVFVFVSSNLIYLFYFCLFFPVSFTPNHTPSRLIIFFYP